jgi:hypothetical protein
MEIYNMKQDESIDMQAGRQAGRKLEENKK